MKRRRAHPLRPRRPALSCALAFLVLLCTLAAAIAPAAAAQSPTVELLEPGDEPRYLLRFRPQPGSSARMEMTMAMMMSGTVQGNPMPSTKLPGFRMMMDIEVVEVRENGDMRWKGALSDVTLTETDGVPQAVLDGVRPTLSGLAGMKADFVVSDRGLIVEGDLEMPPSVDPQIRQLADSLKQSMQQLSTPLPAEPVGRGARWRVSQEIDALGMTMKQTMLFEAVEVSEDRLETRVELTQSADPQKISQPGMPPGVEAELLELHSTGSGEMTFDLSKVMPTRATVETDTKTDMKMVSDGQSQTMSMQMRMKMTSRLLEP